MIDTQCRKANAQLGQLWPCKCKPIKFSYIALADVPHDQFSDSSLSSKSKKVAIAKRNYR